MKSQLNGFMFPYEDIREWQFTPPELLQEYHTTLKDIKMLSILTYLI